MSLEIVLECAKQMQEQSGKKLWENIGPESEYFHPKSSLDSLMIVELLVAILSKIKADITLEDIFALGIPKTLGDLASSIDAKTGYKNNRVTKLIIFDCDDTLWEGVALMGPVLVRPGVEAQLNAWSKRGCVLAICSKNDPATVEQVLDSQWSSWRDVFIAARVNWQEKGENVVRILNELKLLPENAVFLDNDPFERGRVAEAVPGIWCPDIAIDGSDIAKALLAVDATIPQAVTAEDKSRAELYKQESERNRELAVASSYEDWLAGLGIEVTVRPLKEVDRQRAEQLVDKAHQFKLTSARHFTSNTYVAEYRDKFGSAGIIGVVIVVESGVFYSIGQFVMSCRVIGRGVEQLIYDSVCKQMGGRLYIEYAQNDNNAKAIEWAKKVNAEV